MSHPGSVDIIDFVLLTIYPVGALFIIEILSRIISRTAKPVPSWLKLSIQGIAMVGFAVTYTAFMPFLINQDAYTVETACYHSILFACTCSCIVLSGKTRKNQSKKISLLTISQICLAFFGTRSFSQFRHHE